MHPKQTKTLFPHQPLGLRIHTSNDIVIILSFQSCDSFRLTNQTFPSRISKIKSNYSTIKPTKLIQSYLILFIYTNNFHSTKISHMITCKNNTNNWKHSEKQVNNQNKIQKY